MTQPVRDVFVLLELKDAWDDTPKFLDVCASLSSAKARIAADGLHHADSVSGWVHNPNVAHVAWDMACRYGQRRWVYRIVQVTPK